MLSPPPPAVYAGSPLAQSEGETLLKQQDKEIAHMPCLRIDKIIQMLCWYTKAESSNEEMPQGVPRGVQERGAEEPHNNQ
ncbi:hypothetical protein CDAR_43471 [Caerostris darwini]|uniref:Uncharacterized protein n=1 Tax=Caerostris darwini TaxID=1538125 RepID=A0AAV4WGE9_9ARAC|nr:hypothetical protein CDAR_43471 [Caerostris darwini]